MAQTQAKKPAGSNKTKAANGRSSSNRTKSARKPSTRAASSRNGASSTTKSTRSGSRNGNSTRANSTRSSGGRKSTQSRSRSTASSNGGPVDSVKETVSSGAQTVADTAKKAKTGLLAGGAAVAGLAATVALSRHQSRPKVLGVTLPKRKSISASSLRNALPTQGIRRDTQNLAGKVGKAAERADRLGQSVSRVASSVKQVSETAGEAAKK